MTEEKSAYAELLADEQWCVKLAYLADIFKHLNELNIKMQGKEENLLSSSDKLRGFRSKLTLWRSFVEQGRLDMFPLCNVHVNSSTLSDLIAQHLKSLDERFNHYFPSECYAQFDWVRDPWSSRALESATDWPLPTQEQLMEIREDRTLKMRFGDMELDRFWISLEKEYPVASSSAVAILLPFSTTYLCELSFSSLTYIKNKYRERLRTVDQELRVCLSVSASVLFPNMSAMTTIEL